MCVSNTYNKSATYNATLLRDKLQEFVARITSSTCRVYEVKIYSFVILALV